MSKHMRIGLVGLVTVMLLLAVVLPGLAKKPDTYQCDIWGVKVHVSGAFGRVQIFGELDAYWKDGVLYNTCKGVIPWGEPIEPGAWRYATFEESCDYMGDRVSCSKTILSTTKELWGVDQELYDPETDAMVGPADDFTLTAHKYSGKFVVNLEYTPD
jgi:hypothetical protein